MRYSPKDISEYRLAGTSTDEVSVIMRLPEAASVWNAFWLSMPDLDHVPGSGRAWFKVYKPVVGMLAAVYKDVVSDEVFGRKVVMHPIEFSEWFDRQDLTRYESFRTMQGANWAQTVANRARLVTDRLILNNPPVRVLNGKLRFPMGRMT